ncbi:hypothetical protein [Streptomyces abikoensis]
MTIMTHPVVPVRPEGAVQDISDVLADAVPLTEKIAALSGVGVAFSLTVENGSVTADITLERSTAGLMEPLAASFGAPGLAYPETGIVRAVGVMGQGRIAVRITAPDVETFPSPHLPADVAGAHRGRAA